MGPQDTWVGTGSMRLEPSDRDDSNINSPSGEKRCRLNKLPENPFPKDLEGQWNK